MKAIQSSLSRRALGLLAGTAVFLSVTTSAPAAWNLPQACPAGEREEFAKAAVATDLAGNVFSAGYHDYGGGDVRAFVTYRNAAAGAVIANDLWRPTADQYYYTGVVFDPVNNCLYLTGTRIAGAVSYWFVRKLNVNPGVGFVAGGWTNTYTPASFGLGGALAYGGSIAYDGANVYVSGCFGNGLAVARLVPGTGVFDAVWGTGYRVISGAGWVCPFVTMPGSTAGGIYQSVRLSYVRVTATSVFLGGSLDRLTGTREDFILSRVNKGTGAMPWGIGWVTRDNGNNNDEMLGLTAIGDYCYATGVSVNGGNNWAYTVALMADGTNRGGTPLVGAAGSYANDIEAWDNAGTFTTYIGGNSGAAGIIVRYTSTATGAVSAPAPTPYGAVVSDEVCDLTIGSGAMTGVVYATGQTWNAGVLSNCQQIVRIAPGSVTGIMLPAGYNECYGNAVIYTPNAGGHVFTHGNSLVGAGFGTQHTDVAP